MCTQQSRKVIWDMRNTLFLTLKLSNLLLLLSFSTHRHTSMASPAMLSNFFEKQWTQNHPQYLSGLSRAVYPTTFLQIAVNGTVRVLFKTRLIFPRVNGPIIFIEELSYVLTQYFVSWIHVLFYFSLPLIYTLLAASISHFLTAALNFHVFLPTKFVSFVFNNSL